MILQDPQTDSRGGGVKNMQQFERDLRKACLTGKPSSKTSVSTIPSACDIVTGYSYIDLKDREEDGTSTVLFMVNSIDWQ